MEVVNNAMQKQNDECPTLVFMEHPRKIHHPKQIALQPSMTRIP
jgi:hypothetical protein